MKRPSAIPEQPAPLTEFASREHMIACFEAWGLSNPRITPTSDTTFHFAFWLGKCGFVEGTVQWGFLASLYLNRSFKQDHSSMPDFNATPFTVPKHVIERWKRNRRRITNTGLMPIAESEGLSHVAFKASPDRRRKRIYLRYDKLFARFVKR